MKQEKAENISKKLLIDFCQSYSKTCGCFDASIQLLYRLLNAEKPDLEQNYVVEYLKRWEELHKMIFK